MCESVFLTQARSPQKGKERVRVSPLCGSVRSMRQQSQAWWVLAGQVISSPGVLVWGGGISHVSKNSVPLWNSDVAV